MGVCQWLKWSIMKGKASYGFEGQCVASHSETRENNFNITCKPTLGFHKLIRHVLYADYDLVLLHLCIIHHDVNHFIG